MRRTSTNPFDAVSALRRAGVEAASVQSGERIITVIPCEVAESSPSCKFVQRSPDAEGLRRRACLLQAKLSRNSNQIARGRIRRLKSYMPSQSVRSPRA